MKGRASIKATESDNIPHDRLWRVKYWYKKSRHSLAQWFVRFVRSKRVALWFPPMTAAYYLTLDVWGDKLSLVKEYEHWHKVAFFTVLGVSLGGLFVRGFIDEKKTTGAEAANALLTDFIKAIGIIVDEKTARFRKKLLDVTPQMDKFRHITHPDDQLRTIFRQSAQFLCRAFSLEENQIDITIMKKRDSDARWSYLARHQNWKHADANELMDTASAAKLCAETGEPVFHPDKVAAARVGNYSMSRRDKRRQLGSAYVMPLSFQAEGFSKQYIISIITYGKQFCDDWDDNAKLATSGFLREMSRRMEVELCLHTINKV